MWRFIIFAIQTRRETRFRISVEVQFLLAEREQAVHHQAHLGMSDTCRERMQICKVLTVQGHGLFLSPSAYQKKQLAREGAMREDLNRKKKNNFLLHRTFIQFHTAF